MSASRNEARGLSGNQYFAWHAEPLSIARKLRKRFPVCYRSELSAGNYQHPRAPLVTGSRPVWASFAHRQRPIHESGPPSRWPDWPIVMESEASPASLISDWGDSFSLIETLLGSLPTRDALAPRVALSRFTRQNYFRPDL